MVKYRIFSEAEINEMPQEKPVFNFISECKWTSGRTHMMHMHDNMLEVILVVEGNVTHIVGHKSYFAQDGDIFIHNSNTIHDEQPFSNTPYHTLCLGIMNLNIPGLPKNQLLEKGVQPLFRNAAQYSEIKFLMERLLFHISHKTLYYPKVCQEMMLCILVLLQQMIDNNKKRSPMEKFKLSEQVQAYIDQHFVEDLSLELLGNIFYVSTYHLAHVFKKETGYTLKQYILRRRIGEAQSLLVDTDVNVGEIAHLIGFEDVAHFSKMFQKYVGMAPSDYRIFRTRE